MAHWRFTAVVACALSLCTGCMPIATVTGTQNVSCPTVPAMQLQVETSNGSISVKPTEEDQFSVVATVRALNEERLDEAKLVVEETDGALKVFVEWPDRRRNNEGADFEIGVPNAEDVQSLNLRSSNGKLSVNELTGRATLKTSNGQIDVAHHIGDVQVDTSNGRIDAKDVTGAFTAESSNGKITATDICGKVDVESSNASIRIVLTEDSTQPFQVKTSNGSAKVQIGEAFSGQIRLKTSNGSVRSSVNAVEINQSSKKSMTIQIGDSDEVSSIRSSNGSVELKERDESVQNPE